MRSFYAYARHTGRQVGKLTAAAAVAYGLNVADESPPDPVYDLTPAVEVQTVSTSTAATVQPGPRYRSIPPMTSNHSGMFTVWPIG